MTKHIPGPVQPKGRQFETPGNEYRCTGSLDTDFVTISVSGF